MNLPLIKDDNQTMQLIQTKWSSILNPLLAKPISSAGQLKGINLINGVTVVNHLLGRTMQGWIITDSDAASTIYRSQPFNNLTLTLTSNAACTVDIMVF